MPEQAYYTEGDKITLSKNEKKAFIVYQVGLIPYEWIEYLDPKGDEYAFVPLFYCKFNGRIHWKKGWRRMVPFGYPYKEVYYYRESETYREGDPLDMKWCRVCLV